MSRHLPPESHLTVMLARGGLLLSTVLECIESFDAGPAFAILRDELRIEAIETLETAIDGIERMMDDLPPHSQEVIDQCWARCVSKELCDALKHMRRCGEEPETTPTPSWALEVLRSLAEHEVDGSSGVS